MSNTAWLIVALTVTFLAIGGYSLGLISRRRALLERLDQLDRASETRP